MPRAGLSHAVVVAAASSLIDERGADALTLATLADQLGVRAPSLYKHVDGLPALRRQVMLDAKVELAGALASAAVGRAGVDAVRCFAQAYRSWATRYPGRYAMTVSAPHPSDPDDEAASDALFAVVRDVLGGFGLDDTSTVDAVRYLRSTVHGFVVLEAAGAFALPVDLEQTFDRIVDTVSSSLVSWGSESPTARP